MSENEKEKIVRKIIKEEIHYQLELKSLILDKFSKIDSLYRWLFQILLGFLAIILTFVSLIGLSQINEQIDKKLVEPTINMRISNIIDYELKNVENKILELEMSAKSLENIVKDVRAIYFNTTFISKREHDGTTLKIEDICKLVVDFTEEECIDVANNLRTKGYKHFKDIKGQINMDTIISN